MLQSELPWTRLFEQGGFGLALLLLLWGIVRFSRFAGPLISGFVNDVRSAVVAYLKDSTDRFERLTARLDQVLQENARAATVSAAAEKDIAKSLEKLVDLHSHMVDEQKSGFAMMLQQFRELDEKLKPRGHAGK